LEVDMVIELPDHHERFFRELETACFRIAQEALTNIVRHAQASHVLLQLVKDEKVLLLSVKDNGRGFDVESLQKRAPRAATLGLISMQERAHAAGGAIEIDSVISEGTEVRFVLNLEP
jgi:signal transduction histidine kinase